MGSSSIKTWVHNTVLVGISDTKGLSLMYKCSYYSIYSTLKEGTQKLYSNIE